MHRIQRSHHLVECQLRRIFLPISRRQHIPSVCGIEISHFLHTNRQQLVAHLHNHPVSIHRRHRQTRQTGNILQHVAVAPLLEFLQRSSHILGVHRFQQIVYAVHLEGIDGKLVVSRHKHDRCRHLHAVENGKCRTVAQVNIHEYQLGRRLTLQPSHRLVHTFRVSHHLYQWVQLGKYLYEIVVSSRFVFNYQYLHFQSTNSHKLSQIIPIRMALLPSGRLGGGFSLFTLHSTPLALRRGVGGEALAGGVLSPGTSHPPLPPSRPFP